MHTPLLPPPQKQPVQKAPWFKSWFDSSYYHQLYGNRTEEEAANFINNLVHTLKPAAGSTMLDVGCGAGRHCRQLARKGFRVTGIDLSASSIRTARKRQTPTLKFLQHDMRLPFGRNAFNYIFNLFTSFGYFNHRRENLDVIANMSDALQARGTLVFDYLNVQYTEARLVPVEYKEIDGVAFRIGRWADKSFFYKKIEVTDIIKGENFEYTEQVSKFTLADFKYMFSLHGLTISDVFGDYNLSGYDKVHAPRLVMIVQKA